MTRTTLSLIIDLKREVYSLTKLEQRLLRLSSPNYPKFKFTDEEIKIVSRAITRKKNKIIEIAEQINESEETKNGANNITANSHNSNHTN